MIKKIVIDLDDTISFCHDRNWANAQPNIPVIRKMNELYNAGWEIVIFSSRGQLSRVDYFNQVQEWLANYGVLYTGLQFGKPLGVLYVDDKACTPQDFVNLEVQTISSGWSGSQVIRIGNKVHKTDKNISSTVSWYSAWDRIFYCPKIESVIGDQLVLKYVRPKRESTFEDAQSVVLIEQFFSNPDNESHDYVVDQLDKINTFGWSHYIDRIENHCASSSELNQYSRQIVGRLRDIQPVRSICHGDLTPSNVIIDKHDRIVLIDPLNVTYPSWELDQAKLIAWSLLHEPAHFDNGLQRGYVISVLVLAELTRMYKYAPEQMKTEILNQLKTYA